MLLVSFIDQFMDQLPQRQSLAAQTADFLRTRIAAGTWSEFLPGERDLCRELQVSRPTLRAALEILRHERVVEVAQGQRRRICSRTKRRHPTSSRVVLLTPNPTHRMPPFVIVWVDELRQRLAKAALTLEIHISSASQSSNPEAHLERLTTHKTAAAWILFLSGEPTQKWFASRGLPCVVAGSCFPGVKLPSVDVDARAACRHAATLLLNKGHERIALLLPAARVAGDEASEAGFLEGASSLPKQNVFVTRHDGTPHGISTVLTKLIESPQPVTAMLVARSLHALTVLTYLQKRGLRIPSDIAIVSRDADEFLEHVVPRLTRYACSPMTFANRVSRIILKLAKEGTVAAKPTWLVPELIKGETL